MEIWPLRVDLEALVRVDLEALCRRDVMAVFAGSAFCRLVNRIREDEHC